MSEKQPATSGPIAMYFVPMGRAEGEGGRIVCPVDKINETGNKDAPVHVMDARTRGDVLSEWIGENLGPAYKNAALTVLCAVGALAALLWVHWAVAAVLAYAAGYKFSDYLALHAFNIQWYKGKSMLYTE